MASPVRTVYSTKCSLPADHAGLIVLISVAFNTETARIYKNLIMLIVKFSYFKWQMKHWN